MKRKYCVSIMQTRNEPTTLQLHVGKKLLPDHDLYINMYFRKSTYQVGNCHYIKATDTVVWLIHFTMLTM